MKELITVLVTENGIFTTEEAQSQSYALSNELVEITVVNSPETQEAATKVAVAGQAFVKEVEASRKAVKAPVLELAKRIDTLADELSAPVKGEMVRVGALVAKFQQAEAERVKREREDREKKELAAMEAARLAAQKEREAVAAMNDEASLAKAVAAEEEAKRKEKEMYATLTAPAPAAIKAKGSATRTVLKFEVTDIHALYAANRALVKLEPNTAAIKAICVAGQEIPGLKVWEEQATSFRA